VKESNKSDHQCKTRLKSLIHVTIFIITVTSQLRYSILEHRTMSHTYQMLRYSSTFKFIYCDSRTHCVEKRHFLGNELLRQLHENSQFLGNRFLDALHNHQRPLLVNGCIDTYSRSNKQSLRSNETNPSCWTRNLLFQLEKNYLKSKTVSQGSTDKQLRGEIQPDCGRLSKK
jgi:hypothetical protein